MPCFNPLRGFRARSANPETGKRPIVFSVGAGYADQAVSVPCGQCVGCRLEKSRQWAMRCMHEADLYERNCFITLTYRDDCLPLNGSLDLRAFQLFMKRLRKKFGSKIRFFHCGEYGEQFSRPHYHACLFNFDFPDKVLFTVRNGVRLYTSLLLEGLWPFGFSTIGDVTFESAAYVARYVMKKVTGDSASKHYGSYTTDDGVIHLIRKPEYITMSRRPGIGRGWFDKFSGDVYPDGRCVVNGKLVQAPKFYDGLFEQINPEGFKALKAKRSVMTEERRLENDSFRLPVREAVAKARCRNLRRTLEEL